MGKLLEYLYSVNKKRLFHPQYLVVPRLRDGHALLEGLAAKSGSWFNIRPVTPLELARQTAEGELEKKGLEVYSRGQQMAIVESLLKEMALEGELEYFAPLQGRISFCQLLLKTIEELSLSGLKSQNLQAENFVNVKKGQEIKKILANYQQKMADEGGVDAPALYEIALKVRDDCFEDEAIFLIPGRLELPPLARRFLEKVTKGRQELLAGDPVFHLPEPPGFWQPGIEEEDGENPASWLFSISQAPEAKKEELQVQGAYSISSEVRQVFRSIMGENLPLDQVLLCYTQGNKYIPELFTAASRLEMPVTFGEGIPIYFSGPGRLLQGILEWFDNNYASSILYRLLLKGDLNVENHRRLAVLLRRANIGWGRERYFSCLPGLQEELTAKSENSEEEGRTRYYQEQIQLIEGLLKVIGDLLRPLPKADSQQEIDFSEMILRLGEVMDRYSSITSEMDGAAREGIMEELKEIEKAAPAKLRQEEALNRIAHGLEKLYTGAKSPLPGHLHITHFRRGSFISRPRTFLLGLDAGSFPGSGIEDPLLLDTERKKLGDELLLMQDEPTRNTYRFAHFLASCRGKTTLSFASYDVALGRTSFPSAILLQVERLKTNNKNLDYTQLMKNLGSPAGYFPVDSSQSLGEEEWWMERVLSSKCHVSRQQVMEFYPFLQQGYEAFEKRSSEVFTEFDGFIGAENSLDPRVNKNFIVSATMLEKLASCPFAAFLRHVLQVYPPEEKEYDPGQWLDPLARGLLLHEIYCSFLRQVMNSIEPWQEGELLREIACKHMDKMRQEIPPPSEIIFQAEKQEILRGLEVFLRLEEELQENHEPLFLEVPMGYGPRAVKETGLGSEGPVIVSTGKDKVLIRGRIDRVDRLKGRKNQYCIWDYKTGSTFLYQVRKFIDRGRQLQHALYSEAAEAILKEKFGPEAKVVKAGYLFPTERGEGRIYEPLQKNPDIFKEGLEKLLDILARGTFCATTDDTSCGICDYQVVCRYPDAILELEKKLDDSFLQTWRELQDYE